MVPIEIIKKVRLVENKTRHIVNNLFGGEYHSAFKGMGMEFAEVREYYPGDDIGAIDWCWSWGCSRVCSPDTYYKNWVWFVLDTVSFLLIVIGYMLLMHKWDVQKSSNKKS